jgi:GT2 family glycosyltransferase/glycosyltransferase involved in cell wall biosynthesis
MQEQASVACPPTGWRRVRRLAAAILRSLGLYPAASRIWQRVRRAVRVAPEQLATSGAAGPTNGLLPRLKPLAKPILQPLGLYPIAERSWHWLRHRYLRCTFARSSQKTMKIAREAHSRYDVICLPVISWHSRFQRPQQLIRQFAAHGHRTFYAALGFHAGAGADLAPLEANVFEMSLPGDPAINVYQKLPSAADVGRMAAAIDRVRLECRIGSAVVVVQLPFWTELAEQLRRKFGWRIVYDCMDDHAGFSTNRSEVVQTEDRTIAEADLVVVTADVLHEKVKSRARRTVVVRNACDYDHFAGNICPRATDLRPAPGEGQEARALADQDVGHGPCSCRSNPLPKNQRTTIGFYGAIAGWFDADLAADLAELRPDWRFQLIGSTLTGDTSRLEKLSNVVLLGERAYADLPRLTADWDCFIIPFKRIPLTEATNPVKAYEMLATGKPVVAVDLPELRPMARQGLLALADDASQFAQAIEAALAADAPERQRRRREFAAANTWLDRWRDFDAAVRELFPPASILIVTYHNLSLNKACLNSIFHRTDYPNYEVIVVDNASADGTPQWLSELAQTEPRLQVIRNRENRGYAAANNQALRKSRGEFLCLLNNDTLVTQGWLSTLIGHLQKSSQLGLVGPVSNMVGNEALVDVGYKDIADMPPWAETYCRDHDGETVPVEMLGFFCVAMRRSVYREVGELDEQFGLGYFEDDDYCHRVRRQGYELRFVRDAFVHHWKEASFGLLSRDKYIDLYSKNRKLFESKWDADNVVGQH